MQSAEQNRQFNKDRFDTLSILLTLYQYSKILRKMATMKTMATVKSYENEVNENYSITIKKNWNDAHNNKQLTMHNKHTNDDVDIDDCVAYMH